MQATTTALRAVRHRTGLPVNEVAYRMKVDPETIRRWERGDSRVSLEDAVALLGLYREKVPGLRLEDLHG